MLHRHCVPSVCLHSLHAVRFLDTKPYAYFPRFGSTVVCNRINVKSTQVTVIEQQPNLVSLLFHSTRWKKCQVGYVIRRYLNEEKRVLSAFQVQVLIWTGDSGSNPERTMEINSLTANVLTGEHSGKCEGRKGIQKLEPGQNIHQLSSWLEFYSSVF